MSFSISSALHLHTYLNNAFSTHPSPSYNFSPHCTHHLHTSYHFHTLHHAINTSPYLRHHHQHTTPPLASPSTLHLTSNITTNTPPHLQYHHQNIIMCFHTSFNNSHWKLNISQNSQLPTYLTTSLFPSTQPLAIFTKRPSITQSHHKDNIIKISVSIQNLTPTPTLKSVLVLTLKLVLTLTSPDPYPCPDLTHNLQ